MYKIRTQSLSNSIFYMLQEFPYRSGITLNGAPEELPAQ
jgi:hypothetical protein